MRKTVIGIVICIIVIIIISILYFFGFGKKKDNAELKESNAIETASGESAVKEELIGTWISQTPEEIIIKFNEDGTGELTDSENEEHSFNYNVSTEVIDSINTKYVTIQKDESNEKDKIHYVVSGDLLFLDTENPMYANSMRREKDKD